MIEYNKNRRINLSKPVKVYWNLQRNCYSVQQNGLVVAYANKIKLWAVRFKVNEKARQRVLKERRKNVHAFVVGSVGRLDNVDELDYPVKIVYNPYKSGSFMSTSDCGRPIRATYSYGVCLETVDGKGTINSERGVHGSFDDRVLTPYEREQAVCADQSLTK